MAQLTSAAEGTGRSALLVNVLGAAFLLASSLLRSFSHSEYGLEFDMLHMIGAVTFGVCWCWSVGLLIRSVQARENSKWVPILFFVLIAEFLMVPAML